MGDVPGAIRLVHAGNVRALDPKAAMWPPPGRPPHPNRPARATALVTLAQDLPPAVLGPMLGLHPVTAAHWRRRAATDWTAYLQARQRELADRRPPPGP
ncbi:hypothetical protein OKJ48_33600 [Streptomyces kunmingensis]|uniref:Uncharacterized protein n=1 Tax=Streptomyces kunmingensis TaxID=68225 RepID=A0ABU6CK80_9ACTN|nr:hypothetical protein [Streptomyces kunmingensis]MEB3965126.1 hypothetical protein [Streptomyces kunmingensis]